MCVYVSVCLCECMYIYVYVWCECVDMYERVCVCVCVWRIFYLNDSSKTTSVGPAAPRTYIPGGNLGQNDRACLSMCFRSRMEFGDSSYFYLEKLHSLWLPEVSTHAGCNPQRPLTHFPSFFLFLSTTLLQASTCFWSWKLRRSLIRTWSGPLPLFPPDLL